MDLTKKIVNHKDYSLLIDLDEFIKNNTIGTKKFRYFSKRPYKVIENHIYTCLYYDGDKCVGYGHLDTEDDIVWLGILVGDMETGKKIGSRIMDDLILNSDSDILLSVDIDNDVAISVYEKKEFHIIETLPTYHIMKLNKKLNK
jgi:ribosomal protein S18 acetylase RimI-like enzyme